jgi:peptidoglycan/xylan/chitin deacetylase (PgdA/CDA1 family)
LIAAYKRLPAGRADELLEALREAAGDPVEPRAVADPWLGWDELREVRDAGVEIGNHTASHPILERLPERDQRAEIEDCSARIEDELGARPVLFSYPVGRHGCRTRAAVRALADSGIRLAFSCYGGVPAPDRFDPFDVPRIPVGSGMRRPRLAARLLAPARFG